MIKWIWRMLWGSSCDHNWEIHERRTVVDEDGDPIGRAYDLRCDKCGDMCSREFRP